MGKILKTYTFKGFGFDVLLRNVVIKSIDGEEYPDINLNELKTNTAKALLVSKQRLTGHQLKFLRTYLKMSFDEVFSKIHVPASTLRSWENKGTDFTGFTTEQEKAFRIMAVNQILEQEKSKFNIEVTLIKSFQSSMKLEALDISSASDSLVANG
ncbi:helix-turn-helix domain-containing protein [Bdellovibrio bacteriovorus]|uniref:helix-turn-helix domain-containing protein n=1 Tax=Bdellovibrio TaxID=958 RepID=UPI0035A9560E